MSVLPLNWPDKVDSPELLAWLQQFGLDKYIDSNQINSIRDALNELYFSSNPDRIISLGTETIDGNEHTYEDYTWQLGGVQVNNIGNPSVIVIPSATVGFKRKDISVFTPAGTIERVAGTETDGEVVTSPDVPEGTLYYKSYDIDGDTIGVDPEPPAIDGSIYKKKIENTRWKSTQSGANVVIPFQAAGQSHYSVVHSGLISVAGFSTAALTTPMYEGQDVLFENQTGNPITLKDSFAGVNTPFDLGADLVVPNEGKIWFRSRNGLLEMIMKSWVDIDLSTKADLVGGKVPASQLPSSVFNVIEGYFNGTNFYTDALFTNLITPESSKIYLNIAVTPATQYRWSGSAYVHISSSETFEQSRWQFNDFVTESSNLYPFIGAAVNGGDIFFNLTLGDSILKHAHFIRSGTSANGGYRVQTNGNNSSPFFSQTGLCFFGIFRIDSRSDARNRVIRIGYHNTINQNAPSNGAFLEIIGNSATFKTINSGVETSSSVFLLSTSPGGLGYRILIEWISNTSVKCKLVDTSNNLIFDITHSTNVPASNQRFNCGAVATNTTAGTLVEILQLDYMGFGLTKPNFLNNF